MSQSKKLLADALKLPRKSRAILAEKLLESLDDIDELDALIEEADRRRKAYEEGKTKAFPIEEIFPNLATKMKRAKKA